MKKIVFISLFLIPFTSFALEYEPLVTDDLPVMHILVINSTIVALYCTLKLILMFVKRMRD